MNTQQNQELSSKELVVKILKARGPKIKNFKSMWRGFQKFQKSFREKQKFLKAPLKKIEHIKSMTEKNAGIARARPAKIRAYQGIRRPPPLTYPKCLIIQERRNLLISLLWHASCILTDRPIRVQETTSWPASQEEDNREDGGESRMKKYWNFFLMVETEMIFQILKSQIQAKLWRSKIKMRCGAQSHMSERCSKTDHIGYITPGRMVLIGRTNEKLELPDFARNYNMLASIRILTEHCNGSSVHSNVPYIESSGLSVLGSNIKYVTTIG